MRPKKAALLCFVLAACFILAAVGLWIRRHNTVLTVSYRSIDAGLDEPLVIVQLSDLHGARFGKDQDDLAAAVSAEKPDVIVITGDMIDRYKGGYEAALEAARRLTAIAPTYYVEGNHEQSILRRRDGRGEAFLEALAEAGVMMPDRETVTLREGVTLTGFNDLGLSTTHKNYLKFMEELAPDADDYAVLIAHRPEFAEEYAQAGFDLALCGHAHGGQVRAPLLGALYAPGQGLLPKRTEGLYDIDGMTLAVSRGLGNSGYTFRVNNPPELVVLTLGG